MVQSLGDGVAGGIAVPARITRIGHPPHSSPSRLLLLAGVIWRIETGSSVTVTGSEAGRDLHSPITEMSL
jgi:hypothetical protein